MARPIKEGLDYFPLDVDADYDDKFQIIESLHGVTGFTAVIKIMMKIYSGGYYYLWGEQEQILMAKRIGIDSNSLNNILADCIKYGLFHEKLFQDYQVLTSKGIQSRYFTAVGKKKKGVIYQEYLLLEIDEISYSCPNMAIKSVIPRITNVDSEKTEVIPENSTQRKEKKRKEKEIKEKNNNDEEEDKVLQYYMQTIDPLPTANQMDEMDRWQESWRLDADLIIAAMDAAADQGKKTFAYVRGIVNNCKNSNIKTVLEFAKQQQEFGGRFGKSNRGNYSQGQQVDYDAAAFGELHQPKIDQQEADIEYIIGYLNKKAGVNYSASNNDTRQLLKAILREYPRDDCLDVIDKKVFEWIDDPDMKQYLRPATLFKLSNFENYLNQIVSGMPKRLTAEEKAAKEKRQKQLEALAERDTQERQKELAAKAPELARTLGILQGG